MSAPRKVPDFISPWTAPFHVSADGIKDARGCWICDARSPSLANKLVELMNYAAETAAIEAKEAEAVQP